MYEDYKARMAADGSKMEAEGYCVASPVLLYGGVSNKSTLHSRSIASDLAHSADVYLPSFAMLLCNEK